MTNVGTRSIPLLIALALAAAAAGCAAATTRGDTDGEAQDPDASSAPDPDAAPGEVDAGTPGMPDAGPPPPMCLEAMEPCTSAAECCSPLACDRTSLGQVCCGNEGASCATAGGEDCCGALLCIDGRCGLPMCSAATTPCTASSQCCAPLACARTSLGMVCCGNE